MTTTSSAKDNETTETRRDLVGFAWGLAGLYVFVFVAIIGILAFGGPIGLENSARTAIAGIGASALTALHTPMVDIVRAMIRRYAPSAENEDSQ